MLRKRRGKAMDDALARYAARVKEAERRWREPTALKSTLITDEMKLAMIRVQLYTAAQVLTGESLRQFWQLIDEIQVIRRE